MSVPWSLKINELKRDKVTQEVKNVLEKKRKNSRAKILQEENKFNNFLKPRSRAIEKDASSTLFEP